MGAHPSYPDRENFGRQALEISDIDLSKSLREQLLLFKSCCDSLNISVHHVKPHGALYNAMATDKKLSGLVCSLIKDILPNTKVMGLAGSQVSTACKQQGLTFIAEAFADRKYQDDGTLTPRSKDGAVLNHDQGVKQALEITLRKRVMANDWMALQADSICLHGDSPDAIQMAKTIHQELTLQGIAITSH